MLVSSLLILLACGILFAGAELLVRGGASLALKLGLTPLVIGLTVVAFGTSAPELLVSLKAAWLGQSDIAIGNVVGSNIFNIAVILGLSAVVFPINTHLQVLRWDAPVLVVVSLLLPLVILDGHVSRVEGIVLVIGIIAYTVWAVRMAKKDEKLGHEANIDMPEIADRGVILTDIVKIVAGLAVLVLGSRLLVTHSIVVAKGLGVSEMIIGLTIIAAGTSMPELATSVVAAFRKQSDIALGNVLGSNLFNLLFVLGGSATIHPVRTSGLQPLDLWYMIGLAVVLVPMLATGRKLSRMEGGLLAISYVGYLACLWPK